MMRMEDELLNEASVESQFDGPQIPLLDARNTTLATLHRVSQDNEPSYLLSLGLMEAGR
jgi:hypothetical protein